MTDTPEFIVEPIGTPEFIVEPIGISEYTWKFFNNTQDLEGVKHLAGVPKKFTSMATNATIFRWKFGDQPGNPIIETTTNPYIHTFLYSGTYSVSHQSCYPCFSTGTQICSNGWCTKSIEIETLEEKGQGSIIALAGFVGLLFIAKEDNCCDLRKRCVEKRAMCKGIKPEDVENIKECNTIEKMCNTKLENCRKKCIKTGNKWESFRCIDKQHRDICRTIHDQKIRDNKNNIRI